MGKVGKVGQIKKMDNNVEWLGIELKFARRCLSSCSRSMAKSKRQIQRKTPQMLEGWAMIFQSQRKSLKQKSLRLNNKTSQIKQQNIKETPVQFKIWVSKVTVLKISADLLESELIWMLEGKVEFKDPLGSRIQMNLQKRLALLQWELWLHRETWQIAAKFSTNRR